MQKISTWTEAPQGQLIVSLALASNVLILGLGGQDLGDGVLETMALDSRHLKDNSLCPWSWRRTSSALVLEFKSFVLE